MRHASVPSSCTATLAGASIFGPFAPSCRSCVRQSPSNSSRRVRDDWRTPRLRANRWSGPDVARSSRCDHCGMSMSQAFNSSIDFSLSSHTVQRESVGWSLLGLLWIALEHRLCRACHGAISSCRLFFWFAQALLVARQTLVSDELAQVLQPRKTRIIPSPSSASSLVSVHGIVVSI